MARYIVGDPVVLTVTFTVASTATDPDTVSLAVTDPAGTETTYTYAAGTVTKSSTGVYTKTVTTDSAGTWTYKWTGTGAAPDVEDGTFDVWPVAASDTLDVLSLGEAKQALNLPRDNSDHDDELRQWITAVSRRLDALCGPVVTRTVSAELHDGGGTSVMLRNTPVASVTAVTEYDNTTSTALTAETNASKPSDGFLLDGEGHTAELRRRSSNGDGTFPSGRRNVEVTYKAGRAASTAAVDPLFKQAAGAIMRRLWQREQGAWATGADPFVEGGTPGFFKAVDPMVAEMLPAEMLPPAVA